MDKVLFSGVKCKDCVYHVLLLTHALDIRKNKRVAIRLGFYPEDALVILVHVCSSACFLACLEWFRGAETAPEPSAHSVPNQ